MAETSTQDWHQGWEEAVSLAKMMMRQPLFVHLEAWVEQPEAVVAVVVVPPVQVGMVFGFFHRRRPSRHRGCLVGLRQIGLQVRRGTAVSPPALVRPPVKLSMRLELAHPSPNWHFQALHHLNLPDYRLHRGASVQT